MKRIIWSIVFFFVLAVLDLLLWGEVFSPMLLVCDVVAAIAIIALAPFRGEKTALVVSLTSVVVFAMLLISVISALCFKMHVKLLGFEIVFFVAAITCMLWRILEFFEAPAKMFRNAKLWSLVRILSRNASLSLAMVAVSLLLLPFFICGPDLPAAWSVFLLTVFSLIWVIACFGYKKDRLLVLGRDEAKNVYQIIRSNDEDRRSGGLETGLDMPGLFKSATEYMNVKQPYLDCSMSLEDLAAALVTNRVYLSKTINVMSGHNFRQFVNEYRVRYAQQLLIENPHEKMSTVAFQSGFHTVPSFNMAFKLFVGETPSEWLGNNVAENGYSSLKSLRLSK